MDHTNVTGPSTPDKPGQSNTKPYSRRCNAPTNNASMSPREKRVFNVTPFQQGAGAGSSAPVPGVDPAQIFPGGELGLPHDNVLAMMSTANATDLSYSTSEAAYSMPCLCGSTILDCYPCPQIANPCSGNSAFVYPDGRLIHDFTLYPSPQPVPDMSSLVDLEMPTTSRLPQWRRAQIEGHPGPPWSNEDIAVETLVCDMWTNIEIDNLDTTCEVPLKSIAGHVALQGTDECISLLEQLTPTDSPPPLGDLNTIISHSDSIFEDSGDCWISGNATPRSSSDPSHSMNSQGLHTGPDAFYSLDFEDGMSDSLLASQAGQMYTEVDAGGTVIQALDDLDSSAVEPSLTRALESNLSLKQSRNKSEHLESLAIDPAQSTHSPPVARRSQAIAQTVAPGETMLSPTQTRQPENPWNKIEAGLEAKFRHTADAAAKGVKCTPTPITDKDCPSHIEYRKNIRPLGQLSEIPELSDWYASPAERHRQMLGLPGTVNSIDEKLSTLMTALDSALQQIGKTERQHLALEAGAEAVLQNLLSSLREPKSQTLAAQTKPCHEEITTLDVEPLVSTRTLRATADQVYLECTILQASQASKAPPAFWPMVL